MEAEFSAEEQYLREDIQSDLATFEKIRGNLIPILQMIQEKHAYLAPEALKLVAEHLEMPTCEVYGVATFYNQFRFHPPGKNPIKVCLGTACHVRGGDIILENFERKLGISEGQTTADKEFSIERVACVGCCALAPVSLVGEVVHGHMAPSKVEGLILSIQIEKEKRQRERLKG
jgi:NADH-quinone oxidoreductase subunit E